ncbi:hypothetical protein Dsin_008363 [Dipteronia sinensis]|uniref:DWNN domain-containing protein n=1 Tax=Dipteronia sinensis TaxID=43782 RepID=A0AAE0ANJ7_9ROSI|nr:hypothetical protein Dsin_008363 [Dipteronia sinensis]
MQSTRKLIAKIGYLAVYYKFKSARDYDSISMDGPFTSVGTMKEKIFESKHLGGTDLDLLVTNAKTNEEYMGAMLIPKNTSVLIRRVPGLPRRPRMLEPEPPQGYVCRRCKVPGMFTPKPDCIVVIYHCPTNGDPKYDVKRFKHPTGIPKSMLIATPDGSYALPSGAVAVLRPNEAAFEKEIEGLPSTTRSPTISAASKGEQQPPPGFEETLVP